MSAAESEASRHAIAGLLAKGKISLPVASPVPARGRDETKKVGMSLPRAVPAVVTGRKPTTADAVRKYQFAAAQNFGTNARQ
jgi:hypothetical protein